MDRFRRYGFHYTLVAPAFVLMVVFRAVPFVKGVVLSFQELQLLGGNEWVGLSNYRTLFGSVAFLQSFRTTVVFTVVSVPSLMVFALCLALLLNAKTLRFGTFFRAAVFMPYVTSGVVVSIIWKWFLSDKFGMVNVLLTTFGLPAQRWLSRPGLALASLILVLSWKVCGYFALIFLANLQLISQDMYEAAAMDGANPWQRFWHITLPHLRPAMGINAILATLTFFSAFEIPFVMTGGGPGAATELLSLFMYKSAFIRYEFGLASAGMVVMFIILTGALGAQLKLAEGEQL